MHGLAGVAESGLGEPLGVTVLIGPRLTLRLIDFGVHRKDAWVGQDLHLLTRRKPTSHTVKFFSLFDSDGA